MEHNSVKCVDPATRNQTEEPDDWGWHEGWNDSSLDQFPFMYLHISVSTDLKELCGDGAKICKDTANFSLGTRGRSSCIGIDCG